MKEHKHYIERGDLAGATHLQISIYYSKGGRGMFFSGTIPRGYYLSIRPVTKRNGTVSYSLFSGRSRLLLETKRYSEKQFAKAVEMAKEYEDELIAAVVAESKAA